MTVADGAAGTAAVDAVIDRVKRVYRSWGRSTPVSQMRADWDALFSRDIQAACIENVSAGGVSAQWIAAPGSRADKVVVYLHGGGFQLGSVVSHRDLMFRISQAAGCRVLGVDYRLAPEHRFPAPLQDALVVHDWLIGQGYVPSSIALAGDSAGGGLALCTLLALRDAGRALPVAAAVMSPWTDLSASGESYVTRSEADPIHQRPMILAMARNCLGADLDPRDPRASPLFARLQGLPPLLIQAGDRETVLSDATLFAAKAQAAGVTVQLEVWDGMIHVFQQFADELSEARAAIASLGDFLALHLRTRQTFNDKPEETAR